MTTELKENIDPLTQEIEEVRKNKLNIKWLSPDTYERIKNAKITKLADNIYTYSTDWWLNIKSYSKKNWEWYFWLQHERELPFFENICWITWVVEKNNNWVYEMYKKEWWNKNSPNLRKIDIYSMEYFEIWRDINFYNEHSLLEAWKRGEEKKTTVRNYINEFIEDWIEIWNMRIKDLLSYMKKWEKEVEPYKTALKKLEQILPQQCLDVRFDKIWDPITTDPKNNNWELETYLKEWFISKDIYDKCIQNLKRKQKDKLEIHSATKKDVLEIQLS
jgi:hypothetical protein